MKLDYTRGSIFFCQMPEISTVKYHSVEKGYRPVVIVSSFAGAMTSDIVMVCPLTTKIKPISCNVNVSWSADNRNSQVLCNQIMTVPKMALSKPCGHLTDDEMLEINTAILVSLGIAPSVTSNIQKSQEALINAKKDAELLQRLMPEAKSLITQLNEVIQRVNCSKVKITKKGRIKRSAEEIADFIKEWEDPGNIKSDVAEAFGFNSYSSAYSFWRAHK